MGSDKGAEASGEVEVSESARGGEILRVGVDFEACTADDMTGRWERFVGNGGSKAFVGRGRNGGDVMD